MKKKQMIMLLLAAAMVAPSLSGCGKKEEPLPEVEEAAEAAEPEEVSTVTQEFEFYSDDEHIILYNFPETYEEDGVTYTVTDDVELETLGTRDVVQMAVDMNVEELEEIPETYEYESKSGRNYELENEQVYVKEQGVVAIPVVEEIYYEDQIGPPSIPERKTITYYDRTTDEDKEVEARLTNFVESTPGHWANTLNINGVFTAPAYGVDVYELAGTNNVTVPQTAEAPVWDTYQRDVLSTLGLSSKYFCIKSAAWDGGQYEQDGYVCRNAIFSGDAYVATYKATYETEREAEGYSTKVYYRVDAEDVDADDEDITTVYRIKAVIKYQLIEV